MIELLLTQADTAGEPWWLRAALGSLGALVLAVIGNVMQWRRMNSKEEEWGEERDRLQKAIKNEADRATEYGERALTLMTKSELHLEAAPLALKDVKDTVLNEHVATRAAVDSAFQALEPK